MATAAQIEASVGSHQILRFDPEFELLLACCRADISPATSDLEEILSLPHLKWDRILKLAEHHRLLPVLAASICGRNTVPGSIQLAIRDRSQKHARRTLCFSAELARILHHFYARGIEALAHKGPALGQLLYADPASRQFGDLDFLVRAADVPRAAAALGELGYEPRLQLSPRQQKAYRQSGYEYVFRLGAQPNLVELQWQIVPRFYAIDFDMEALFRRAVDLQLDAVQARALGNEDLLLVLCVHAAKHQWSQLAMLRDIATLARRQLNWRWINAEARLLGILNILMISLLLTRSLFHSELPQALQVGADFGNAEKSISAIQSRLSSGSEMNPESLTYFRAMMQVRERRLDRLRFAWRLASTPSVSEWQMTEFPDVLFPLYRILRLLRLMRRFALSF